MVMAIDLYEEEAPSSFCHFTTFGLKKLRQFVDSSKELTAQSYRFFVEHAYNQCFQHEAFHQSATARTKAREFTTGNLHTSTTLEGYVWIAGKRDVTHVPKDQADDVEMQDQDEDADEELDLLPSLQVFVKPQEGKGVGSQEREETQEGVSSPQRERKHKQKRCQQKIKKIHYQMQHLSSENLRTGMDSSCLGSSNLHINDSSMRLHSLLRLFSEVMIWKEDNLYSVVTSVIFPCL